MNRHARYNRSEKGRMRYQRYRESHPIEIWESNQRRLYAGGMYLGMVGFTKAEIEAMVRGATRS